VIVAIGLAIAYTPASFLPDGQRFIRSISHYYYTPARIIFVGALCAAALALLTLAGKGVQSYLLDIAALLAPLIAIIPTPVKLGEVTSFDPQCERPNSECVPRGDFDYLRLGFTVWLWIAGIVIGIGVLRAIVETVIAVRDPDARVPWMLIATAAIAVGVWVFYFLNGQYRQSWFHSKAHFLSAGAFFVIVAIVIAIEAYRHWLPRSTLFGARLDKEHGSIGYAWTYTVLALLLFADLVMAAAIISAQSEDESAWPSGVFAVEAFGLFFFAVFFGLQTWQHRADGEGWGKLPPRKKEIEEHRLNPELDSSELVTAGEGRVH
jgi:hypothetical protein